MQFQLFIQLLYSIYFILLHVCINIACTLYLHAYRRLLNVMCMFGLKKIDHGVLVLMSKYL
jgi:hypothetical protein